MGRWRNTSELQNCSSKAILFLTLDVFCLCTLLDAQRPDFGEFEVNPQGTRLEMIMDKMRLTFGSEMTTEWRFGSDLPGTVGPDELRDGDSVGSKEKRAGETRQGWR